ncbi:MAG: hypothetical protein KJZ70_01385 [Bryobacterales bacterium]|nr:hypothetical protein [Bryobacterales bacterium]
MPDNIIQMAIPWVVLTLITIALAIYKKSLDVHTDESLHIGAGEDQLVKAQMAQSRRSDLAERWGKILTIVVFLYGIVIVGMIAYHQWQVNTTAGFQ